MKCDELKVHKAYNRWMDEEMPTPNDDLICNEVYLKSEVDSVIDELKTENETLLQQNRELCCALQVMYTKEEYDKLKAENAELKQKLEDAKATAYAESVDAGMRERRLCRALYKSCANWAKVRQRAGYFSWTLWGKMKDKCLNKVEEYK